MSNSQTGSTALPQSLRITLSADNIQLLKSFPRPPQDNGIGLHFHTDLSDFWIQETVKNLTSIRATWTLIYAQDELQTQRAAAACWAAGIMPVVRVGKLINEPIFDPVPYVNALKAVGAPPYVQIYNEPEDNREWKKSERPGNWPDIFGDRWARLAEQVVAAGGFVGIQVLDRPGFDRAVDAVNARGIQHIWRKAFFVHHNYGANHPPDYPYDERNQQDHPGQTILQDYISVLKFQAHAHWMLERIGFVLPMMGGEGGWLFGSEEDKRYPKIDRALHARYHVDMFNWLRTGVISTGEPLPDYLFSIVPWIAGSFTFGAQNWWNNIISPDGKLTETIEAVQAIPPFVRRFSWDDQGGVGPEPEPEPEPQPQPEPEPQPQPEPEPEPQPEPELEPEPEPEPQPPTWDPRLDQLGVRVARNPQSPAWRVASVAYLDNSQSGGRANVFFTTLNADGSPAAGQRVTLDWEGRRSDENPCIKTTGADGKADCPLFTGLDPALKNGFSFATVLDRPADVVRGLGLPHNQAVCYLVTFRLE